MRREHTAQDCLSLATEVELRLDTTSMTPLKLFKYTKRCKPSSSYRRELMCWYIRLRRWWIFEWEQHDLERRALWLSHCWSTDWSAHHMHLYHEDVKEILHRYLVEPLYAIENVGCLLYFSILTPCLTQELTWMDLTEKLHFPVSQMISGLSCGVCTCASIRVIWSAITSAETLTRSIGLFACDFLSSFSFSFSFSFSSSCTVHQHNHPTVRFCSAKKCECVTLLVVPWVLFTISAKRSRIALCISSMEVERIDNSPTTAAARRSARHWRYAKPTNNACKPRRSLKNNRYHRRNNDCGSRSCTFLWRRACRHLRHSLNTSPTSSSNVAPLLLPLMLLVWTFWLLFCGLGFALLLVLLLALWWRVLVVWKCPKWLLASAGVEWVDKRESAENWLSAGDDPLFSRGIPGETGVEECDFKNSKSAFLILTFSLSLSSKSDQWRYLSKSLCNIFPMLCWIVNRRAFNTLAALVTWIVRGACSSRRPCALLELRFWEDLQIFGWWRKRQQVC